MRNRDEQINWNGVTQNIFLGEHRRHTDNSREEDTVLVSLRRSVNSAQRELTHQFTE